MTTTAQWIEMVLVAPVPLVALAINGADFLIGKKKRRGSFLYLRQTKLKDYLAVHGLLLATFALWAIGRFTPMADSAFQLCSVGWVVQINIHAMLQRRKRTCGVRPPLI